MKRKALVIALLFAICGISAARAATTLSYHGGPVVRSAATNVIFWLPTGTHFVRPPLNNAGTDTTYENAMTSFLRTLPATSYLNILTQYPGQCALNACTAPLNRGGVSVANVIVDTDPYPSSPLQDSDVKNVIHNAITSHGIGFSVDTPFLVFLAAGTQECDATSCTITTFCAYHNSSDWNNGTFVYAVMPAVDSLGSGCAGGVSAPPPGQLVAVHRELVSLSHELFETITDPIVFGSEINFPDVVPLGRSAWWDSTNVFGTNYGNEIGDECNQQAAPVTLSDGSLVFAQNQWSDDTQTCVSSFGPSIQFDVSTGSDNLRDDSMATVGLISNGKAGQVVTIKPQGTTWDNDSTHRVVKGLVPAALPSIATPLTDLTFRLLENSSGTESPDNWNLQTLSVMVLDPTGRSVCKLQLGGDPLFRFTIDNGGTSFAMPGCPATRGRPAGGARFNQIRFVIATGTDDLRGDSSLTATLLSPTSSTLQVINVKAQNQLGFDGHSTHDLTFALAPLERLNSIGSIQLTLTSHDAPFETDDNWDVAAVNITLQTNGSGPACFANVSGSNGNPFDRLTGDHRILNLTRLEGCP